MTKPLPDYWVIKGRNEYLSATALVDGRRWVPTRKRAHKYTTLERATNALITQIRYPSARVVAVRRKPSVRARINELVARCMAAIDERRCLDYPLDAKANIDGRYKFVTDILFVLSYIDPAAAAEIRAYWERKP